MKFSSSAISVVLATLGAVEAFVPSTVVRPTTELFAERKPFITGNWKLNPATKAEAVDLASGVASQADNSLADVAIFVPSIFIESVQKIAGGKLNIGAEVSTRFVLSYRLRIHPDDGRLAEVEKVPSRLSLLLNSSDRFVILYIQAVVPYESGAYTGGISPGMLKSMGVTWALAGHSERRTLFGESDEDINAQCKLLIENGMNVVLCIGETENEYEKNLVGAVCELQLKKGLSGITAQQMSQVTIAYEPVWAIGTGKVATPEIAQDVHSKCRAILKDMYGDSVAEETRILYGGSVSPDSVDGLMAKPDIDGTLVGGASLNANSFGRIINFEPALEMIAA